MALVYILFGWLLTVAASIAAGALLGQRVKTRFSFPLAFVTGSAVVSLAVFTLGISGLVYKGTFLALGLLVIGGATWRKAWATLEWPPVEIWFWAGFAPFTVLYFLNAAAPEMSPDGMAYHLGLVARYYREHRLLPIPDNMYASLSQGVEMLFLFAYTFGRHSAAALVHFSFLVSLALMIAQTFPGRVGTVAALLVYASPIVGVDGVSAYVDVAVAAVWFALFVLARGEKPAVPMGVLAGFAFAAKYTAGLALLYAMWQHRKRALVILGVALIFMLPWLIRNWLWLGNPVAPFANAVFPNPHITVAFEREYSEWMRHYGVVSWREWVTNITVRGEKLGGFLGPIFLLAPLGITEWGWLWAGATYPLNVGTRFLIPALPFLAVGMAKRLCRWTWLGSAVLLLHLVLSWPAVYKQYAWPYTWFLEGLPPTRAVLRREPEDEYLNHKRAEYRSARLVETFVPAGERVFTWSGMPEAYTSRRVTVSMNSAHGYQIRDILAAPSVDAFQPTWRHDFSWTTPRRVVRVFQDTGNAPDRWSISEILPRPVSMKASHYDFETALAFDGNPLTRWHCGWPVASGQWVELTFDQEVTRVSLWLTRDQYGVRMHIDGAQRTESWADPPPNLRRLAADTVKALGIKYLLIDSPDLGYADFRDRRTEWGITELGERGATKLYRLD